MMMLSSVITQMARAESAAEEQAFGSSTDEQHSRKILTHQYSSQVS